jgi:plasmid stabilization system protein ParE
LIVVWTDLARDRLADIHDYIASDAPETADDLCEHLIVATEHRGTHGLRHDDRVAGNAVGARAPCKIAARPATSVH